MVRAYRWPRGVVSLLVVCMLSLGPFAQGVDVSSEGENIASLGIDLKDTVTNEVTEDISESSTGLTDYQVFPPIFVCTYDDRPEGNLSVFYPNEERDGYNEIINLTADVPHDMDIDDFNMDGILDLVYTRRENIPQIIWGEGIEEWNPINRTQINVQDDQGVGIGDFDGDGDIDLFFSRYNSVNGRPYVFLNKGDGTFNDKPDIVFPFTDESGHGIGDLNNDGFEDIVLCREQEFKDLVECYYGGPNGPDTKAGFSISSKVSGTVLGDYNNDGFIDIAYWNLRPPRIVIYHSGPNGPDANEDVDISIPSYDHLNGMFLGDPNGDGLLDIVCYVTNRTPSAFEMMVYQGSKTGFSNSNAYIIKESPRYGGTLFDLDKDGCDDLIWITHPYSNNTTSHLNIGFGGTHKISKANLTKICYSEMEGVLVACGKQRNYNGTIPSAPQNVTVGPIDRGANISWLPPLDNGGFQPFNYKIYRGSALDPLTLLTNVSGSTSYIDNPPALGSTYYYAVSAVNIIGESNRSDVLSIMVVGSPDPPQRFEGYPGNGNVTLTWSPPAANGGLPVSGYLLKRGIDGFKFDLVMEIGIVTSFVDEDVENGQTYHYTIQARNSFGMSDPTVLAEPAVPIGPPTEPMYMAVSERDSELTLEWRVSSNDGGRSIIGYRIFRGLSWDSLELITSVGDIPTNYVDTDLTNGVIYYYAVQAYNEIGDSPWSTIVNGTPKGLPGAPLDIRVDAEDGQVIVEWEPPSSDGGTDILGYLVFRGPAIDKMTQIAEISSEAMAYKDRDVANGNTYFYAVRARNAEGVGPITDALRAVPLALPDAPGNLVVVSEEIMVKISWLHPPNRGGAEIDKYVIYRGSSEDALEPLSDVLPDTLTYLDSNIIVGMKYYYAVSAVTIAGKGPKSITVSATPYGKPGIPVNLAATPTADEITLTWTTPKDDGASSITGYVIMRSLSVDSLRKIHDVGPVTTFTDDSVVVGQPYHYAIAAVNAAGTGPYTEPISVRIEVPDTPPSRVPRLTVTLEGTTVTLQWSTPVSDGGKPLTGYVMLRGPSQDELAEIAKVGPDVTSWTDEGLERGNTYYYSVAPLNDVGEGEAFAPYPVKVPKEKEVSPGFEVALVAVGLLLIIPIIARRRD